MVFVVLGVVGIALLVVRDRWFGALLLVLGVVNVYFYANYLGDLSHYLLLTWLILAIGLAITVDRVVSLLVGVARGTGVGRPVRGPRPAGRPAGVELDRPRPVRQPRRRRR